MPFQKTLLATAVVGVMFPVHADETQPTLEVMVVTASLTEKTTQTAPAFTSVLSAEDIAAKPLMGLSELLEQTVGINNLTDASGRDQLQLRGLSGSYTLVLINGKRVSSSSALWRGGDFDLSAIPLNSIQQIEVVRGPMSSIYGADAIGGVVNILTKQPTDEWQGTLSGEAVLVDSGDGGTQIRAGISARGGLAENLHLSISAESYDRDAWYSEGETDDSFAPKFEEKKAKNLFSTLRWHVSDQQNIDVDVSYNKDERPYSLYYAPSGYRVQDITRTTLSVTHQGHWDWGKTSIQLQQENGTINDFNSRYDAPQDRELTEDNSYLKAYTTFAVGHANQVTTGVDYRYQVVGDEVSYQDSGDVSISDAAFFLQDEITLTEQLTLTLGGRVDDNEFFGSQFTPRAYVVYQVTDALTLKGGVSEAFKAPQAYQLSEEYHIVSCGGSCFLSGDPSLEPETSANYEFGLAINNDQWDMSAVYFQNEVENMITTLYDAEDNQRYWSNVDEVTTSGIELEGTVNLSERLRIAANFTTLDTEDTGGKSLENRPEQTANINLHWALFPALQATFAYNYMGQQITYVRPAYVTLPAYSRFNLGFSSEISDALILRYGVNNLTDVQTQEEDENFNTYELGRNAYISASYQF